MTPNVLTETRCHQTTQTKPNQTKLVGDKVNMLAHTYPHKPLRKIKVAIRNHQVDGSF